MAEEIEFENRHFLN